ncbi:hypothetical protein CVT25_014713 [Psilocybe cyanescens]|uniref:Uncharacterized protein n=1 Tax=Psilocybe cyanescens TaxID=93625 RepID=A0A409XK05_PSICY|nr:hypothetical protein CVT25_014713 [Psilocybe cyanescens]
MWIRISATLLVEKSRVALNGAGWGTGASAGGAIGEVTTVMRVGKKGGGLKEGQGKEGLEQVKGKQSSPTFEECVFLPFSSSFSPPSLFSLCLWPVVAIFVSSLSLSPDPFFPKAPAQVQGSQSHMRPSTALASVFASSSAFASTSHSNVYLFLVLALEPRPRLCAPLPPGTIKIVPMTTEEDEENMEAGQRLAGLQQDRVGSVATMISAYSYNETCSRSGTLNLTRGSMLAPPGAFVSRENVNTQRQERGAIARRAIKRVWLLAWMGSWAQLKGMPAPDHDNGADVGVVSKKEKKGKDAKVGRFSYLIPTIEEVTADRHGRLDDRDDATSNTPDMTPLHPSASMSPSSVPVSTPENAKALNNGSQRMCTQNWPRAARAGRAEAV